MSALEQSIEMALQGGVDPASEAVVAAQALSKQLREEQVCMQTVKEIASDVTAVFIVTNHDACVQAELEAEEERKRKAAEETKEKLRFGWTRVVRSFG